MEDRDGNIADKGRRSGLVAGRLRNVALAFLAVLVFLLGAYVGSASSAVDPSSLVKLSQDRPEANVDRISPQGEASRVLAASGQQEQKSHAKEQHSDSVDDRVQALQHTRPGSPSYVKKTHFKDGVRFLFIAGLEGSGHHAWQDLFWACWKEDNACHVPQALQKTLYKNSTWGLFNPITPLRTVHKREWMALRDQAKKEMQKEEQRVGPQMLSVLNVAEYIRDVGEMSYPNFIHGPERSLRRPDVTLLANIAEEAGADLRILVLRRDAPGIYHSTVTHRHFMPGLPQVMMLIDNAHSLFGQLMSIDPSFVRCISNYGTDPDVKTRGLELASFVHPAFTKEKAGLWQRLLGKIHKPSVIREEANFIDSNLIGRLKAATDLIDSYCDMLP